MREYGRSNTIAELLWHDWHTIFLRSDAVATIFFAARFSVATIQGWLLFKGGYCLRVATI